MKRTLLGGAIATAAAALLTFVAPSAAFAESTPDLSNSASNIEAGSAVWPAYNVVCSVGVPVEWSQMPGRQAFLTAGHCGEPRNRFTVHDADNNETVFGSMSMNGWGARAIYGEGENGDRLTDIALVTAQQDDQGTGTVRSMIGGKYPISGVRPMTSLMNDLFHNNGIKVCKWGAWTGESCGTAVWEDFRFSETYNNDDTKPFSFSFPGTIHGGDSGGPVYTVDAKGNAQIVGLAVATPADGEKGKRVIVTGVYPWLAKWGLTPLASTYVR